MFTAFYSATKRSINLYPLVHDKLKEMENNGVIDLIHFPGFNYIEEQNYFPKAIMLAIEESDIIVALLDKEGRENQWINQEVGYAMAKGIDILALAESRKELMGFVNMNTKTIIEGDQHTIPGKMEEWLNKFGEEKEEEIFEKILGAKFIELRKYVDWEQLNMKNKQSTGSMGNIIKDINLRIDQLEEQKAKYGFYKGRELDILLNDIKNVYDLDFSNKFKNFCDSFQVDLSNIIEVRDKKYK